MVVPCLNISKIGNRNPRDCKDYTNLSFYFLLILPDHLVIVSAVVTKLSSDDRISLIQICCKKI